MTVQTSRPSNIALIKYMGKTDSSVNLPANGSLSYTLEHLRTFIELQPAESGAISDTWGPLLPNELKNLSTWGVDEASLLDVPLPQEIMKLSPAGEMKFLKFLAALKAHFGIEENLCVRTINNFPSD
ncbi:MAG: hypothetical protein K2X47_03235, partial [Bdellovibrionales bacterium]|nr:hypothetical protein [Bdellovibrionales bacterium]